MKRSSYVFGLVAIVICGVGAILNGAPATLTATKKPAATARPAVPSTPATPVPKTVTCSGSKGEVVGQCLACYDFCTPGGSGVVAGAPGDVITTSAHGKGTECHCCQVGIPPSLAGAAQFSSFLESWNGIDSVSQLQQGQFPYSAGLTHQVHVKLWWKSVSSQSGGPGPRHALTDTAVVLELNYKSASDNQQHTIDVLASGPPTCIETLTSSTPSLPSATVESWVVALPVDVSLVWLTASVPMLEGECFYGDADITLRSSK